jgi:hypothetical protein
MGWREVAIIIDINLPKLLAKRVLCGPTGDLQAVAAGGVMDLLYID